MAKGPQVLVADHDPAVLLYLRRNLIADGYDVRQIPSGAELVDSFAAKRADLLILGLDLVGEGGAQLIRRVRKISNIPIVALSASTDENNLVEAIESGADDYVRKPFGIRELLARVHGVLRRSVKERGAPPTFVSGHLEVDLVRRRVRYRQREIHFSVKPYEVLRTLVENADKVVTYEHIVTAVWGRWRANRVPYVRMAVREIRRLIEDNPGKPLLIVNEPGVGYRLRVLSSTNHGNDALC